MNLNAARTDLVGSVAVLGRAPSGIHSMEVGPDGRQAGEIPLDDLLYDSFSFNLSRQIVGEVRGREVLAMIKAMQSGSGSISTTHSANAVGAIRKLITCAMEAGSHVTEAYAQRAIAEHINVIVQLHLDRPMLVRWQVDVRHGGQRRRGGPAAAMPTWPDRPGTADGSTRRE